MKTITWKKITSVGDATLDQQHEKLLKQINLLLLLELPDSKTLTNIFDELDEYIFTHFSYEEDYMRRHQYTEDDYLRHKQLHKTFIKTSFIYRKSIENSGKLTLEQFQIYLIEWWRDHVEGEDQKYEAFINAHPKVHQKNRIRRSSPTVTTYFHELVNTTACVSC